MCGRYYIDRSEDNPELAGILARLNRREPEGARLEGEVFPGDFSPVLSRSTRGEARPFLMQWGFALPGGLVINARTESAAERPLFRDGLMNRRCAVPASGYFEWGPPLKGKKKTRYYIRRADGAPLLLLAGLYRKEESGARFVILTRDAGEDTRGIHPRTPLILPGEWAEEWLLSGTEGKKLLPSLLGRQPVLGMTPVSENGFRGPEGSASQGGPGGFGVPVTPGPFAAEGKGVPEGMDH